MAEFTIGLSGQMRHISLVVNELKKYSFRPFITKDFNRALTSISRYLEVDTEETVIFSCFYYYYFKNKESPVSLFQLSDPDFLNCNPLVSC